jgi:hypothetical protein
VRLFAGYIRENGNEACTQFVIVRRAQKNVYGRVPARIEKMPQEIASDCACGAGQE